MNKDRKSEPGRKNHRARTPEGREDQLIALAVDQAEDLLRSGNAPTSIIVHYLKLATTKEQIERDILLAQKDLIVAKTEALKAEKDMGELYVKAMQAMREYNGQGNSDDEEDVY